MTQHEDWAARLAHSIGKQVRRLRDERRMSARQLSEACGALGMPIHRNVLANLESGRRPQVCVAELLILGKALGVPPALLIFPVGQADDRVELLPGSEAGARTAFQWFAGEAPFPTFNPQDGKWVVAGEDFEEWEEGAAPLVDYKRHERYLSERRSARLAARSEEKAAEVAKTDEERGAHLRTAAAEWNRARVNEDELRRHRQDMRRRGVVPPVLTDDLGHIDRSEEA